MLKITIKLLIILLLLNTTAVVAQDVHISPDQRLNSRAPRFTILGKNAEGIIVYKYGRKTNEIEAYSNQMRLKWKKELNLAESDAIIKNISLDRNNLLVFALNPSRNQSTLTVTKFDKQLNPVAEEMALDTFAGYKEEVSANTQIFNSENRENFLIYQKIFQSNQLQKIKLVGIDNELQQMYKTERTFSGIDLPQIKFSLVDNDGNVYIVVREGEDRKRKEAKENNFHLFKYTKTSGQWTTYLLDFPHKHFGNPRFDIDNANNRLVVTGFYSDEEEKAAAGIFFWALDSDLTSVVAQSRHPFASELIYSITGKDTTRSGNILYTFDVKDVILRYDGGAILIAESRFDNTESVEMPTFVPSATPSFRTVRINFVNDIIVFSINPDASKDWHSILRKKQVSEEDDGFYSSYALGLTRDRLHFIYNEEIFHKSNINEYLVTSSGDIKRNNLLNSGTENVMLIPRLGKQVSSNEIVVPSYKRNVLRFVKFTY